MAENFHFNIINSAIISNMDYIPEANNVTINNLISTPNMKKIVGCVDRLSWNNLYLDCSDGNIIDFILTVVDRKCNTCNKVVIENLHLPKSHVPREYSLTPPFNHLIFRGGSIREVIDISLLKTNMKRLFGTKSVTINAVHF